MGETETYDSPSAALMIQHESSHSLRAAVSQHAESRTQCFKLIVLCRHCCTVAMDSDVLYVAANVRYKVDAARCAGLHP